MKKCILLAVFIMIFTTNGFADGVPIPGLRYDSNVEVNKNLTYLSGYRVEVKTGLYEPHAVYFYDKEKDSWLIAVYNYEGQYWDWVMNHFDPSVIELRKVFTRVDLRKTELNRMKPAVLEVMGHIDKENVLYDYSNDTEFADFMSYLKNNNVGDEYINYMLHAANNPAKRGAMIPVEPGKRYEDSQTGLQELTLVNNTRYFPHLSRSHDWAGGMELFFRLHDFESITSYRGGAYTLRKYLYENKPIPLIIAEINPLDGQNTGDIQGRKLYNAVEKFHEEKFRTDFNVIKTVRITVDYGRFTGTGNGADSVFMKMDKIFDEKLHSVYGEDALYMYYFTDSEEYFSKIDDAGAHPRILGAYTTDWNKNKQTYLHELGHVLMLRHHFPDRDHSAVGEAHLSSPCLMNYYNPWKSDEFCPLCSYSIGIEPADMYRDGNIQTVDFSDNGNGRLVDRTYTMNNGELVLFAHYNNGRKEQTGTFNMERIDVHSMSWEGDFIVFEYSTGGNNYLGRFTEDMQFVNEYNFTDLEIDKYEVFHDRLIVIYTDNTGRQALGAFDQKFNYLGEVTLR